MEITYAPDIPYGHESIKGIFTFSLYTEGRTNILDSVLEAKGAYRPTPIIYLYGITSYLAMIELSSSSEAAGGAGAAAPAAGPWEGWKVVIHTDKETVDANPNTFAMLRGRGAIVSIVTIIDTTLDTANAEKVSRHSLKVNAILRTARFQPMFHTGVPVLARDADTLFRSLLENAGETKDSVPTATPMREEITDIIANNPDIFGKPLPPVATKEMFFPQKLSEWESHCLTMMRRKQTETKTKTETKTGEGKWTTFFIGIDKEYVYDTEVYDKYGVFEERIPKNTRPIVLGGANTRPIVLEGANSEFRVRGLAGFVTSLQQFDASANEMFPAYATYVFSNLRYPKSWHMLDELYLSYVLYRFAKAAGKLGFVVADYANTDTIVPFCRAINLSSKKNSAPSNFTPVIAYCKELIKPIPSETDDLPVKTNLFWARVVKELVYLLYPEFHLPPQAFVNPLIEGNTEILNENATYEPLGITRKFSYPLQKYGGARRKTRRRQQRRKATRRHRR